MLSSPLTGTNDSALVRRTAACALVAALGVASCGLEVAVEADSAESDGVSTDGDEAQAASDRGQGSSVSVVRLADGDSGWFEVDGEEIEIRLLGYNAPERYENDAATEPSCNGALAETALADTLAEASSVELEGDETDRYGRTLADLTVDGESVVESLIDGGYGLALGGGPNRELMKEAASAGRGMWGPSCGEPQFADLAVVGAEPNPAGRDEENINGEWVELANRGSSPLDLQGWDIRDDSSSHRFPLSGSLEPGATLRIRTGSGQSSSGELFLGSSSPVWSNEADTVLVIDPDGVVAAWMFLG